MQPTDYRCYRLRSLERKIQFALIRGATPMFRLTYPATSIRTSALGLASMLVLEWIHRPEGDIWPGLTLPLDEELLEEDPNRPRHFLYSGELVDPRKVQ